MSNNDRTVNEITAILKEAKDFGISCKNICEEAGMNHNTASRWKVGAISPSHKKYIDFMDAYQRLIKRQLKS